jgi:hypothetical protein
MVHPRVVKDTFGDVSWWLRRERLLALQLQADPWHLWSASKAVTLWGSVLGVGWLRCLLVTVT